MKILIGGGGTGGHFFPALALIEESRRRGIETLYVGAKRGIEKRLEGEIQGEKVFLDVLPLRGRGIKDRLKAVISYIRSTAYLYSTAEGGLPTVVFGGYCSVPSSLSAVIRRSPLFVHEQNSVPSMTNRLFSGFAKKVFITFEHTRRFFKGQKVIKTGIPVRESLLKERMEKGRAKERLGIDPSSTAILFMGGSQGAVFINELALEFAKREREEVILLSGTRDYQRLKDTEKDIPNLRIYPFRKDMGYIYSAVDMAVCRAGAGTITELSLFGVPAVLIPYPYSAGDHQVWNAREIESLGGGITLLQKETTAQRLRECVSKIRDDLGRYSESIRSFAREDSASLILEEILKDL